MCGIAGLMSHGEPLDRAELEGVAAMSKAMWARGPDGSGQWESPCGMTALAHRRLAILDLSPAGAQPMRSRCGRYTVVFNGEIYNAPSLRAAHSAALGELRGTSDTEVLLELFAILGPELFPQLRGMFAAAIWDEVQRELVIVRDAFGIKPLYISRGRGHFSFASQVRSLLASGLVSRDVDPASRVAYSVWGHVPEPRTIFSEIEALPPGSWARIRPGGSLQITPFQTVDDLLGPGDGTAERADLRDVLLDSVRQHLLADVPVGVFLSAGIDSTTLASLAAEVGTELRTVTLGFDEYRGTPSDEVPLAEEVARQLGAQHSTVWLTRADFEGALEEFIAAMDQPTLDGLNTWLVSRAAVASGLKVALSGLGGDEFFRGYDSFRQVPRVRDLTSWIPLRKPLGAALRGLAAPLISRVTSPKYASLIEYGGTWQGAYLLRRGLKLPWEVEGGAKDLAPESLLGNPPPDEFHGARAVSWLESTRYMRNQLLRDSDWAGMAHSLEIRVPLVDAAVTRAVASGHDAGHPFSKRDLAAVARPALPAAVVDRPKTGFTVPVRDWLLEGAQEGGAAERGLRGWADLVMDRYLGSLD